MSILEKFSKNKKGSSGEPDTHPLEKPLMYDKVYEYHHKKAVLEDGRLYDTESAKEVFTDNTNLDCSTFDSQEYRTYFLTPHGRWFSATKRINCRLKQITNVGEYRMQTTKTIFVYGNLRMEKTHRVKDLIGKNDYELYKQYFGEVEEA